ncbi:MAG: hypothetical protein IKV32_04110 [Muribaculaceae bacterium]|nr:hypothetical protein [Muribaculaceae bacterium]
MLEEVLIRNRDIKKCYNRIVKQYKKLGQNPSISTVVNDAISTKAPSYYLTFDYARRLLSQYRRKQLPKSYRRLRHDMVVEIARKVDRLIQRNPSLSESDALSMVLASGNASRFFISEVSARRLINH